MPDHDEIVRLYGPWRGRTPLDAADLLREYRGPWWIAGGWAIEAFTGVSRPHGDLDVSIPRRDVVALQEYLRGRLDVWEADDGALRPLTDGGRPISPTCGNLWLRLSGTDPWEYDVLLMDVTAATWTYRRDARIARPLEDILWTRAGVSYLRPEVQLLHKAPGLRPKDQADFEACSPRLESSRREWLRSALSVAHPGHPWIRDLRP